MGALCSLENVDKAAKTEFVEKGTDSGFCFLPHAVLLPSKF